MFIIFLSPKSRVSTSGSHVNHRFNETGFDSTQLDPPPLTTQRHAWLSKTFFILIATLFTSHFASIIPADKNMFIHISNVLLFGILLATDYGLLLSEAKTSMIQGQGPQRQRFIVPKIDPKMNIIAIRSTKKVTTLPFNDLTLRLRGGDLPTFTTTTTTTRNNVEEFLITIDLLGTCVFAFSGALTAGKNGMDLLGMLIIATVTSVGGGTVRDLMLNSGTVFWMKDPIYLFIGTATTLITFFIWPTLEEKFGWQGSEIPVCTADAVGLAAFAVLGAQTAAGVEAQLHPIMWVVSGLMSACFGGVIRDILCLQRPRIMYPERTMYAPAPLIGSVVFAMLSQYADDIVDPQIIAMISFAVVFFLRVSAFNHPMRLPYWRITKNGLKGFTCWSPNSLKQ